MAVIVVREWNAMIGSAAQLAIAIITIIVITRRLNHQTVVVIASW